MGNRKREPEQWGEGWGQGNREQEKWRPGNEESWE